jgi:thioredoxin-like negative regulator of GroEL
MAANASLRHDTRRSHDVRGDAPSRPEDRSHDDRPLLLFFTNKRSGVARRMSSLVAWVSVTEKARLRVIEVDVDENETFTRALNVSAVPTLLVVHDRRVLARHEGRATGQDIEELIRPHVTRDGTR